MRNIIFLTSTSLTLPWEQLLSLQVVLVLCWARKWSLRTETIAEQVYISYTQQASYHLTLQTGVLIFSILILAKVEAFWIQDNNHTFSDYWYVSNTHSLTEKYTLQKGLQQCSVFQKLYIFTFLLGIDFYSKREWILRWIIEYL